MAFPVSLPTDIMKVAIRAKTGIMILISLKVNSPIRDIGISASPSEEPPLSTDIHQKTAVIEARAPDTKPLKLIISLIS